MSEGSHPCHEVPHIFCSIILIDTPARLVCVHTVYVQPPHTQRTCLSERGVVRSQQWLCRGGQQAVVLVTLGYSPHRGHWHMLRGLQLDGWWQADRVLKSSYQICKGKRPVQVLTVNFNVEVLYLEISKTSCGSYVDSCKKWLLQCQCKYTWTFSFQYWRKIKSW